MPYGIRYMAMCLRKNLKEKFPDSSEEEILKAVGMLDHSYLKNDARFMRISLITSSARRLFCYIVTYLVCLIMIVTCYLLIEAIV